MARIKGSLQRKNEWWYFVYRDGTRYVWRAMKTRDKRTAEQRAIELYGASFHGDESREAYLALMIEQGERARRELEAISSAQPATTAGWQGLFEAWTDAAQERVTNHGPTLETYRTQFNALSRWAYDKGIDAPAALSADNAAAYTRAPRLLDASCRALASARSLRSAAIRSFRSRAADPGLIRP